MKEVIGIFCIGIFSFFFGLGTGHSTGWNVGREQGFNQAQCQTRAYERGFPSVDGWYLEDVGGFTTCWGEFKGVRIKLMEGNKVWSEMALAEARQ